MSEDSDAPEFRKSEEFIIKKGIMKQPLPGPKDKVYELVDIVDESPKKIHDLTDIVEEPDILRNKEPHEVLVIDGRGYEKESRPEDKIHDLVDVVEEKPVPEQPQGLPQEEMRKILVETVEKMAREMIPGIAERVIREEIEKLKQEAEEEIA
ncbi:hypothetical protein SAMN04489760_10943 [Syntrophus gentianae]|uniref:Uncharacterized protein n=1 Tax=Syntrophus gentianae TaxID=43775 RepID=A0A1H7X433_9BACT|nr:hypothetical protein [Syntrophus gentianae]SEM28421.1 hypothetical protein SAMN04489760_10943 [Syntrophus gentianae]